MDKDKQAKMDKNDMPRGKERIDVLLVEQGFYDSRAKAQSALMAGLIVVDGEQIDKCGTKVSRHAPIVVKGAVHPYVSRGGLKLEKAIREFKLDVTDEVMLDIGSSTGGFTDCALQHGASYVYAIDVGYNQLDYSLRNHERVCVMERTNFRYVELDQLRGPKPTFATIDVSFISLQLILPVVSKLLSPGSSVVALIKPQFEAGRDQVGNKGVVRNAAIHRQVLQQVTDFACSIGFTTEALTFSPITGGEGNIEFLVHWRIMDGGTPLTKEHIHELVEQANHTFH